MSPEFPAFFNNLFPLLQTSQLKLTKHWKPFVRHCISSHPGITWVNLGTMGWVTHTKENPVWNMDGYCYLVAINNEGLKN